MKSTKRQGNKIKSKFIKLLIIALVYLPYGSFGQDGENNPGNDDNILDQIVAVVGDEVILHSEIEQQFLQFKSQGKSGPESKLKCQIFEDYLLQKLMVNQAERDSITVSPAQVEMQLDERLNYFIDRIGSRKQLENYFNKSIPQIKNDFRTMIHEQLLMQKVQSEITSDASATPSEIRQFFDELHEDSIPYVESEIQYRELVIYPNYSEEAIEKVKNRLKELRQRVLDNEKQFKTLAVLYSQGPSASKGGEIGFSGKGNLAKNYADAAFKLQEGAVSNVVETEFGFHIIQLIDRRGDKVNTRHILMKPELNADSIQKSVDQLKEIKKDILNTDTLRFADAAKYYSQNKDTRKNGGLVYDKASGNSSFTIEDLPSEDYSRIKDMDVGEISEPYEAKDENNKPLYKIIFLESRSEPHKANLEDDYDLISQMAEAQKKQELLDNWVRKQLRSIYVHVNKGYQSCDFHYQGWIQD